MQILVADTAAAEPTGVVADAHPKCDQCDEPATFAFAWPWGEQGKVCSLHARLLQQTAENLSRPVTLAPLAPTAPVPLTRDERARLKGEVYALEMEAADLKQRGVNLYNENLELTKQVHALSARDSESRAQLKEARRDLEQMAVAIGERDAQHGEMLEELTRLRKLVKLVPPEGSSIVDG